MLLSLEYTERFFCTTCFFFGRLSYGAPRCALLLCVQQLPEAAAGLLHLHVCFAEICQRRINHWECK